MPYIYNKVKNNKKVYAIGKGLVNPLSLNVKSLPTIPTVQKELDNSKENERKKKALYAANELKNGTGFVKI